MTGVRRVIPLTVGWERLPKSFKLKRIGAQRGLAVIPGHDPEVWPALTAQLIADR